MQLCNTCCIGAQQLHRVKHEWCCNALFCGGMVPLNINHSFLSRTHPLPISFLLYIPFLFCVSPLTMLTKFIVSPFKVEHQEGKHAMNKRRKHERSFESTNMDVGLRLLPQITSSKTTSNVLLKSAMRKPNQSIPQQHFCFLKTCNLCKKQLSPDKDIYMYRYTYIHIRKPNPWFYLHIIA